MNRFLWRAARLSARFSACCLSAMLLQGYASAQDRLGAPPATSNQGSNQGQGQRQSQGQNPGQNPGQNAATVPNRQAPQAQPAGGDAETQDMGVQPPRGLHSGAMHGPTPASVPGGRLITTAQLVQALRGPAQGRPLVFDVLGGPERLPGAQNAVPAHQAGSFDDNTQREFGRYLQQVTQGRMDVPMVFYCLSTQCWMSYNAAVRAIAMGHKQVFWYRGGVEAWKRAGQPVDSPQQGPQGQPGGQVQQGQQGQQGQQSQQGQQGQPYRPQ